MFTLSVLRNRITGRAAFRPRTTVAAVLAAVAAVGTASPLWARQHEQHHPKPAPAAQKPAVGAAGDYLVQVGKTPVRASTLRRVSGPGSTRPAPHDAACKDYLVQYGKKTTWASEIGAPCPAGPHKGQKKPLCCVAPLETGKALPPCCKAAQGT